MNKAFSKIALMGRWRGNDIPTTLMALIEHLHSLNIQVVLETETAELIPDTALPSVLATELSQHCELLIAVGGDGNLIRAAHIAVEQNLPVVGINRGSLGFLTDIYPDELDKLNTILKGQYQEEQRALLHAELLTESHTAGPHLALNDVVLFADDVAHMIEFDIYINQQFVCNQRADGLIVASPTGSTAYALSGGGPILQPNLNVVLLMPMFPHTLSNRPLVIPAESIIDIIVTTENENTAFVSCDGQSRHAVAVGSTIRVRKNSKSLQLIHPQDYNYFSTLREKLGWQNRHRRPIPC